MGQSGEMLEFGVTESEAGWLHMTDGEHDFGKAFDYAALNGREKHARPAMQVSPDARGRGATLDDLSVIAAQLVEAACRARDGDGEAVRKHIAHAVALLQCTPSSGPTDACVAAVGERRVMAGSLLAGQARRPIELLDANPARKDGGPSAPTASSSHQRVHSRLRRVLAYISTNIDKDITLADLGRIAAYSPFHFARKFTLAMGVSPHRYVSRMRLKRAMTQLATSRLPLAEIALNAHFSSQASFTRAFHRATGLTPKEYQRREQALAVWVGRHWAPADSGASTMDERVVPPKRSLTPAR